MRSTRLKGVLDFIAKHKGVVSTDQIARELDMTAAQVDAMIQYWIRRGRIRKVTLCNSCTKCSSAGTCGILFEPPQYYELAEEKLLSK